MACWRVVDLLLFFGLPALALALTPTRPAWQPAIIWVVWLRTLWRFYARVAQSHFAAGDVAISILGVPMYCWLLVRSHLHHRVRREVGWKGRSYKIR